MGDRGWMRRFGFSVKEVVACVIWGCRDLYYLSLVLRKKKRPSPTLDTRPMWKGSVLGNVEPPQWGKHQPWRPGVCAQSYNRNMNVPLNDWQYYTILGFGLAPWPPGSVLCMETLEADELRETWAAEDMDPVAA